MKATKTHQAKIAHELDVTDWRVHALQFSPDSRTLILAAHEHDTAIFEVGSGKICTIPKSEFPAERMAFSPDSASFILVTFCDEPLQCWESNTGIQRWELDPGSMDAEFSPDGKTVVATRKKSVLLCDAKDGKVRQELAGHKSRVDLVRFSPDGRRVASQAQSQVCLWDAKNGTLVDMIQEKRGEVNVIQFSPNGRALAVAGGRGIITIYDGDSGKEQHEWEAHEDDIWQLDFSADGKRLLSRGNEMRLWELPAFRQIYESSEIEWKSAPDKMSFLLLKKRTLEIHDASGGDLRGQIQFSKPPVIYAVSPDQKWLAGKMGNEVVIWNIKGML